MAVREVVERLGLGPCVQIRPVVEDHLPWYVAADAFVLCSDVESLPRTLLEAMAFGLPVAVSAVWGNPEVVRDDENGLLFEPRDLGALGGALQRLLTLTPADRARLGDAARRTVQETHNSSGYIDAYRRMLPRLAADPTLSAMELFQVDPAEQLP
ncbi:MAG: glycosyltransferase family 4 protein [Actinobacteria bacterium]|nr:glycosyltransferase family 4 protein [Actinomycetota bacterium]